MSQETNEVIYRQQDAALPQWKYLETVLNDATRFTGDKVRIYIDALVQEICNCSALAMELHLSRTNPSI